MKTPRRDRAMKTVTVGFAESEGRGVAYASVGGGRRESAVRVGFKCRPLATLRGRDVAYAAADAVAVEMHRRGFERVTLRIDDAQLADDLVERRTLPNALVLAYVSLRCKLNRFREARIERAGDEARDLTARARAEVWLNVAA